MRSDGNPALHDRADHLPIALVVQFAIFVDGARVEQAEVVFRAQRFFERVRRQRQCTSRSRIHQVVIGHAGCRSFGLSIE